MIAGVPSMPIRCGRKVPMTATITAPLTMTAIRTVALFGAFGLSAGMMAASAHTLHGRRARHRERGLGALAAGGLPGRGCAGDPDSGGPHAAGGQALRVRMARRK